MAAVTRLLLGQGLSHTPTPGSETQPPPVLHLDTAYGLPAGWHAKTSFSTYSLHRTAALPTLTTPLSSLCSLQGQGCGIVDVVFRQQPGAEYHKYQ